MQLSHIFMQTFSPKTITKELLATLPERTRIVLTGRYGLDKAGEVKTLEAIGAQYGITRERVRQIESHGLSQLRASDAYRAHTGDFETMMEAVHDLGGIVAEDELLEHLPEAKGDRNFVHFLLVVGDPFFYEKEDANFNRRWHVDGELAGQVQAALELLHDVVDPSNLVPEGEFYEKFATCLEKSGVKKKPTEGVLARWLGLSRKIGRNPLGEWGKSDSPNVRVKSMRDLAYLTLKRGGQPMHFTEVAHTIEKLFKRKAHPATCHNELIKDGRFVLVGRGLYALSEWGYQPGVVRDVIAAILESEGPLSREAIIERVKRERYVKDATIAVNLQDPTFKRLANGTYALA